MNHIHITKYDGVANGKITLGGGHVHINGQAVKGVLELKPVVTDVNGVAHVVMKLAVSSFTFGPSDVQACSLRAAQPVAAFYMCDGDVSGVRGYARALSVEEIMSEHVPTGDHWL